MLSLETGACISSPTAYFHLQQIYFSATARESYLVLLSGVILQWVIWLKLPYCALAETVKNVKGSYVFVREFCLQGTLYSVAALVCSEELSSKT